MNALAAAALAAGELVCEFSDGYRKSLLAAISGDAPRTELTVLYDLHSAQVLQNGKAGRRDIAIRDGASALHLIQAEGPTVRVTTLLSCTRGSGESCTRFDARHAWHFDTSAPLDPDAAFARLPSGAASGSCEPWRVD